MRRLFIVLALTVAGLSVGAPAIAGGGGGCHEGYTTGSGTTLDISQNCFELVVTHVGEGESVTWTNRDLYPHNVYSIAFDGSDELAQGESFSYRFDETGVFPYVCTLHPGMMGAVVVDRDGGPVGMDPDASGAAPVATSKAPASGLTEMTEARVTDAGTAARSGSSSPISVSVGAGLMTLGAVLVGLGLAGGLMLGSRKQPLEAR